eukprot:2356614-Rhodomonas_salina.4
MIPHVMKIQLASYYQNTALTCTEYNDALCKITVLNSTVLPSSGAVNVPVDVEYKGSTLLYDLMHYGCDGQNAGIGRTQSDLTHYDISSCDIDSMRWILFLHNDQLYILPSPFTAWGYLLLSISSVITLSGILYLLTNEQGNIAKEQVQTKGFWSLSVLDWVLINASIACTWVTVAQLQYDTFVTSEERLSFILLVNVSFFYLIAAFTERIRNIDSHKHEPGNPVPCLEQVNQDCYQFLYLSPISYNVCMQAHTLLHPPHAACLFFAIAGTF